jgi:hypothetical protein
MIKLKSIRLVNYCGYKDFYLDLAEDEGVRRWCIFYGPNGIGKSNFIRAVEMLSSPRMLLKRADSQLFLRRLTYHPDYDPTYFALEKDESKRINLLMQAVFTTPDGDKVVRLENNWDDRVGLTCNELPPELKSAAIFIDADNRNNMHVFQLHAEHRDAFLDFANEAYYPFHVSLPEHPVEEVDTSTGQSILLYTDLLLSKFGHTRVHYKRFSDGEKKLGTLLSQMFRFCYGNQSNDYNILLVDNIEMHVYFKRHMRMLRKIEEHFPYTQVVCSTHSPIIINEMDAKCLIDLEQYVK